IMEEPQSRLENQPEQIHPFVPGIYGELAVGSFQIILLPQWVKSSSLARLHGKFISEIDLKKNLELTPDSDLPSLFARAKILSDHASENSLYNVSESTWESVDQIHQFAVTTYRDFVTKRLEPLLQLAEE